jgi:CRP-like cAMP-binding protein
MSLEDDISLLRQVEFFSDFGDEHLRLIAFGSQKIYLSQNQELYRDGDRADSGYIIISGKVELFTFKNGDQKSVGKFGSGSLLGELSLLTVRTRTGTAIANEDCELIKISRTVMHRVLTEYPELAVSLRRRISASVLEFSKNVQKVRI